ncbi:MAG: sulfite exporter TauE/SafE family protein [Clostridia bacterium]|nr:sulfite exporter TauE/SafE family protein [Clostridia bacterium]
MDRKNRYAVGGGLLTGAANGLFGGGGGMIAVPYLEKVAKYPTASAHATAIAVVLPATLVSAAVYLFFGLVPFFVFLPVSVGVFVGGFLGAKLLGKTDPKITAVVFSVLMLVAGVRMLL